MKVTLISLFSALFLTALAAEESLTVELVKADSLKLELPASIRLRVKLAELERPEYILSCKKVGLNPEFVTNMESAVSSWAPIFKVSDGTVFLRDDLAMGLWVLQDGKWKCLLNHLRIDKTFGGAPPHLPLQYLGHGLFAFAKTVSGTVDQKSEDGFPQALAVTFLLDSKRGSIVARSKAYVYDHTPPVVIPDSWHKRYKLEKVSAVE